MAFVLEFRTSDAIVRLQGGTREQNPIAQQNSWEIPFFQEAYPDRTRRSPTGSHRGDRPHGGVAHVHPNEQDALPEPQFPPAALLALWPRRLP